MGWPVIQIKFLIKTRWSRLDFSQCLSHFVFFYKSSVLFFLVMGSIIRFLNGGCLHKTRNMFQNVRSAYVHIIPLS